MEYKRLYIAYGSNTSEFKLVAFKHLLAYDL